ncbi:MAG TPA: NHLP-related RiPP peptide [Rhodanobacteraceae bacterium]|jgi:putative modified peptide|nr:NHLP-related RiPP peptide [Rhodanobacteraceae bacterium]
MTDAVLTKKQGLTLLAELRTNPGFRRRFAEKPAAALLEIGVPAETVVNLNARCLASRRVEDFGDLEKTFNALQSDADTESLSMVVPHATITGQAK